MKKLLIRKQFSRHDIFILRAKERKRYTYVIVCGLYLGDFILWWRATPGLWPFAKANFCKPGGLGAKFGLPWFGFKVGNGDFVGGEGEAEADGLVVSTLLLLLPALPLPELPPLPNNVDLLGAKLRNDPPDVTVDVTNDELDDKLLLLLLLFILFMVFWEFIDVVDVVALLLLLLLFTNTLLFPKHKLLKTERKIKKKKKINKNKANKYKIMENYNNKNKKKIQQKITHNT